MLASHQHTRDRNACPSLWIKRHDNQHLIERFRNNMKRSISIQIYLAIQQSEQIWIPETNHSLHDMSFRVRHAVIKLQKLFLSVLHFRNRTQLNGPKNVVAVHLGSNVLHA